MPGPELL
jgi:lipopolysaccharide assembly protein A